MGETTGLTRTLAGHALIGCADGPQGTGHGAGSLNYHHPHPLRPPAPTTHTRSGLRRPPPEATSNGTMVGVDPAFMFTKTA